MMKIKFWIWHVWIALDQLVNALLGGYAGETVSSRLWRNRSTASVNAVRVTVDILFAWDADPNLTHCETAYRAMIEKRFCPRER